MLGEYVGLGERERFRHLDILSEYLRHKGTGVRNRRVAWHAVRSFEYWAGEVIDISLYVWRPLGKSKEDDVRVSTWRGGRRLSPAVSASDDACRL